MQFQFGSGVLFGVPLTNADGSAISDPTPVKFGTLQEGSVEFNYSVKELYGQYQLPVAVGRGTAKVAGTAKFAQLNGRLINSLFFGDTLSTSAVPNVQVEESNTIPATPYQVTVTPPNSGTFTTDLGVTFSATGNRLTRVAASPATGEYAVTSGGQYTFAAADTGLDVLISYEYTESSGAKITLNNQLLGYSPTFRAELTGPFNGKKMVLTLNSCIATKLGFATKLEDFMVPDFAFSAFVDSANTLGTFAFSEQ